MKLSPKPFTPTHDQRTVLEGMLGERESMRRMLHQRLMDLDMPWNQTQWDLIGREMTMLRAMLTGRRLRPKEIEETEKKLFWQECQKRFAKADVAARKPSSSQRSYQPRTDPAEAYG